MPTTPRPILAIQTATLWASGDPSYFNGTGGPGYDPFLGTFNGIVSSTVIANNLFNSRLYGVDAGDQVVFVIAVQNFASDAAAFDITLRDTLPTGFMIPADGADVTVQDGAGNILNTSGNLFDANGGLVIASPLDVYSTTSGTNVALITFTLQATASIAVPLATVTDTAQVVNYAATSGGSNLATISASLTSFTPVQTGTITATAVANQGQTPLASGQTASFDITVTLPEGTVQDLRINEVLPAAGNARLSLVSAQILGFGSNLSATLPVAVQSDGSIVLGTVTDAYDNVQTSGDQITIRVTVANGGTTSGMGTLNTVVSATDPNGSSTRWSTTVTSTVPLATPNTPPTIAGVSTSQNTTSSSPVFPFSTLVFTDPDIGQTETLTVHLSNAVLGTLSGAAGLSTNNAGDYVLSGTIAAVQAAARSLVFTPASGATGSETFGLTLNDGNTGIATNGATTLTIAAATPSTLTQFPISTQTVLTSTATGSSTFAAVQTYLGPISSVQSQYLYDGQAPLAIVAQQSNMLISSGASATAVQLASGTNVVNITAGSAFLTGSSGVDTFLLHADQSQATWNTIVNFQVGDSITIYGFNPSTGSRYWDTSAGATGYTGATLRLDTNRDGQIDSSITFAGKTASDISHFAFSNGTVAGQSYLTITTS